MFARKRTWIGFGAMIVVDALILTLFHSKDAPERLAARLGSLGLLFDSYFGGLTLGLLLTATTTFFLGSLYLALVSGDVIAKESEDGNLRMVLCRPVSRLKLLASKFVAVYLYTIGFFIFIGAISYVGASLLYGWGDGLVVIVPTLELTAFSFEEGLCRYGLGILALGLGMTVVSSIGFLLSCLKMKPAAATILTISIIFIDFIARRFPYVEEYEKYFLTTQIDAWQLCFRYHIPWPQLLESYALLFGVSVSCFVLGWLSFERRDLKA
ncbi:MAG: ABC-2 type transport system permease protein [Verrucomicrobiales bacterium]|jgi:ABC-2 type transport system permease protein